MESANAIIDALDARDPPGWLVQMVNVETSRDRADYAQALSQIKPDNPTQFNFARARLFPETIQPNERSRWTYTIACVIVPLVLLMGVAAYQYRARITAFLTTSAAAPAQPAAQPGAPTIPAYWQAWQAGYMNRAYQIAAWCWAAVWILISLPIVLLLAIPAVSILLDFSAAGFHSGIANARGFAAGFLGWGRLWFALLLLALAGFAVTKLYGGYSLPKPFRPRIRVIRTTIRLVFLAVALLSVGTFLSYFAGIAGGIYANPVVQLLIDILRKSFGF